MEDQIHVTKKMYEERKLTKFLIMFDNSNLLYFPGQFLSGRVIVELEEEMAITGFDIRNIFGWLDVKRILNTARVTRA